MDTSNRFPVITRGFAVLLAVLLATSWGPSLEAAGAQQADASSSNEPVGFRYYEFDPVGLRTASIADGVQLSRFEVLSEGSAVSAVAASAVRSDSPSGERAVRLIDGVSTTKWFSPSGVDNAVVIDLGESVAIDGYRWATANDRSDRDPVAWRVRGSNDGETFTVIDERAGQSVTTTRNRLLPAVEVTVESAPSEPAPEEPAPEEPAPDEPDPDESAPAPDTGDRLLYSDVEITRLRSTMAGNGAFYARGDAGHGGQYSPGDGRNAEGLAREFLDNPRASYWSQAGLPYRPGVPYPSGMTYARPMHAAWIVMTQPDHRDRAALQREVKALLLAHANDPSLDFSDSSKYSVNFHGSAQGPIFLHAQWMTRLMKARDMLGRDAFSSQENATFDRWVYGYANWSAKWLHLEVYGKHLPGRTNRDYSSVAGHWSTAAANSYDGGPRITNGALAYSNRHAAVASAMSLGANYVKHYDDGTTTRSAPSYGVFDVDQLVDHSRLFVEETLRFSVLPQGLQGDFERGDSSRHNAPAQQGWLYSVNVLANLMEMAEYHAGRGDMSVWEYGTTEGLGTSRGAPVAGGFDEKNLHFFAWAMSRYANDGWGRTNRGEPLVRPSSYHDVIPAATAHRFAPDDQLLEAAWKRNGQGFSPYPQSPQSQGPFPAHRGEGGKMIGLIEHGGATPIRGR